jgi:hypothetical protein
MTAADRSFFGLNKQVSLGTPITVDTNFKYMLFNQGAAGVNNVVVPLDQEAGGTALVRDMIKAGYSSGGALEFIPRPDTLGMLLMGLLGKDAVSGNGTTTAYTHVFTMNTDQFDVPYHTARYSPGGLWWEQYQDVRINALTLDFKSASYLRGSVGFVGGVGVKMAGAPSTPAASVSLDPPFTTPLGHIELPLASPIKVLSGSFTAGSAIPLDEQFMVGAYVPDGFDITQRAFALSFNIKVADATLYSKMAYDPAGTSAWVAKLFKDASFLLDFSTEADTATQAGTKHKLSIAGNSAKSNVAWSVTPIGLRSGRQVIMTVTGMFLGVDTGDPLSITLINDTATY